MATDLERLVVQLSADIKRYERALDKAQGVTNRRARQIESRFARMNKSLADSSAAVGAKIAEIFVVAASARGAQRLIDAATRIDNALKVAGLSGQELESTYQALAASAQKNAAPVEALVELYSRVSLVSDDLGVTQQQLIAFIDKVAVSMRVSGKSAAEQAGAILQLTQALGNGVVQAEEYNSMLDGAQPLLQAVAVGLKEASGSVSALTRLVKSGKVSSKAFFDAFEAGSYTLDEKVAGSTFTVGQSVQMLENALIDAARRFNDSTHVTEVFADAITYTLIPAIDELGRVFSGFGDGGPISEFIGWVDKAKEAVLQLSADIGAATGLDKVGQSFGAKPFVGQTRIQNRIDGAFAGTGVDASVKRQPTDAGTIRKPGSVSVNDHPANSTKSGSGRRKRTPQEDFQRSVELIKEQTQAIQAETTAQAGLNPLINDYGYAVEKARAKQQLLTDAKRAGLELTPELETTIEQLAGSYADAASAAGRLAESQNRVRQAAQDMRDLQRDALGGFIRDLEEGKTLADAFGDSLKRIGDRLLDMALDGIFSPQSGGGNIFGSILSGLGSLFGLPGRASGGPVRAGRAYIVGEERPELFVPNQSGTIVPEVPTLPRLTSGAAPAITYAPTYHVAQGADPAAIVELRRAQAEDRALFKSNVVKAITDARKHNVKI